MMWIIQVSTSTWNYFLHVLVLNCATTLCIQLCIAYILLLHTYFLTYMYYSIEMRMNRNFLSFMGLHTIHASKDLLAPSCKAATIPHECRYGFFKDECRYVTHMFLSFFSRILHIFSPPLLSVPPFHAPSVAATFTYLAHQFICKDRLFL